MKLDARRIDGFLANPAACRVVLLHGEDAGLVRARGTALVRRVAETADDPFRVSELERDGWARLTTEMGSVPMTGGRRVVRIREATDAAAPAVQAALASGAAGFAVVEAGELAGRSKLRLMVEAAAEGVAIACYAAQGAELVQSIVGMLAENGLTIKRDALEFLGTQLGGDQGSTRQEIDKLILYVMPERVVTLEDAMALVGDMAGLETDDALYAAILGDVATADRALAVALAEDPNPVRILRACLMMLQKLERVRVGMEAGQPAGEAVRGLRPPVHFRRQADLASAAQRWAPAAIAAAGTAAWEAERECKRTGAPDGTLCRHVVLGIARRAALRRR